MKYAFLILICFGGFAQQPMKDAEIRAFQEGVRNHAAKTQTLSAGFQQERHSKYLAKAAESSGTLSFQKPGKVLWKYTEPASYSVLLRDNKIIIHEQGKRKDMNAGGKRLEKLSKLISGSVSGELFDAPEFSFSYQKMGKKTGVRMISKDAALKRYIREIELTFEDDMVDEIILRDPGADYTRIVFKKKVVNGKIDPNIFNY